MRGRECGTWTLGGVGEEDGARTSTGRRPRGRFVSVSVQSKCFSEWELSVLILEVEDGQGCQAQCAASSESEGLQRSLLSPVQCPGLTSQKQEGECPPK